MAADAERRVSQQGMQPVACPRSARCVALKVAPIKKSRASGGLGSTRLDGRLRRNVACGCLLLVLGAWTLPDVAAESAAFAPLNGQQIRSALRGSSVGDGRHWKHQYLPDGRLIRSESGTSKAGQWSVQGDQLCLLKPEISSTQAACFSVHRRGNELQYLDGQQLVYQGFLKRSS